MGDLESVRVALRVRPLVNSEKARGCQVAVEKMEGLHQVLVNNTDAFSFNFVFDWRDTQQQVYKLSVSDMLDKLFGGFNATILAYGQSGSGKTHTMGTAFDGSLDENVGVIPRAMHDIFERIKELSAEFDFVVKCSFMELYQEQLYDLLSDKSREESVVDMREDRNGILMVGLTEKEVYDAKETTNCLVKGSSGRAVASTAMNESSSRSHAIFTVTLQATKKDSSSAVTTSKFHLVDLAGSERSKKTGATGDRFKEGVKINQGLLALGNVISALGDGKGAGFVRYRDSKLTRLLQDSLGGNSVTLMIACVSPADYNVAETLSTLRYADRARKIKNKPIVNQDPHAAEINRLKGIIQKLRVELLTKGGTMTSSLTNDLEGVEPVASLMTKSMPMLMPSEEQNRKYKDLQEKYRNLQQQWQMTLHDVTEHEMRAHIAEAAHENLKQNIEEMKEFVSDLTKIKENHLEDEKLQETVMHINKLVAGFDNELARTQTEILDHKHRSSLGSSENDSSVNSSEMHAIIQERTEAFTSKQIEINDQLRRINRELNLKEQLQQRMAGNFSKFSTLDDDIEEKFKECEQKIHELEEEKTELLDKLRHVKANASAKLAEERRKRLQTLEQEISDMKRKNTQQAKLLKIREKETQKIRNLSTEIQAMKESKVKLIRAMRSEAENFRQFKMMREKEVMQLKNKDRKMQNEMARKEALPNKQRNVLKRKCEEAMAINKRLKDALEKQKVAQTQRQRMQSAKVATASSVKIDQIIACVEHEVEVIISLIDAERTLEQLMDDRGIISSRLAELENQEPYTDPQTPAGLEIANLQEELEMRNAQISDLQQKVCANDLDTLIRSLGENVQNLAEARAVFKHLLKTLFDMRREHTQVVEELHSQLHTENQEPYTDPQSPAGLEIANLQEELEMRNAQISDLQQKVCANDLDTLIRSFGENVQNLAEARAVFKHLLKTLVDMRREHTQVVEELHSQLHTENQEPYTDPQSPAGLEIANLQKELEMRNAQISDLQQKVFANDLDTLIRSFGENVQNLGEARAVFKHFLKSLVDMRREHTQVVEELHSQLHTENQEPYTDPQSPAGLEIANLQEELEMRNDQISDLQQKVCANGLDTLIRSFGENVQNLGDARAVFKHLLKTLVDMRREHTQVVEELHSQLHTENQEPYTDPQSPAGLEIANLQEELEMRNVQISDHQQKVCANDLDTLIRSFGENVQNLAETRAVFKDLLKTLVDMRREHTQVVEELHSQLHTENQEPNTDPKFPAGLEIAYSQEELIRSSVKNEMNHFPDYMRREYTQLIRSSVKNEMNHFPDYMRREYTQVIEELHSQLHTAEKKSNDTDKIIRQMKLEHEEAIAEYEEKISVALIPEQEQRLKLQEEQEKKIESLMIELENYKQLRDSENTKKRGKTSAKQMPAIKPEFNDAFIIEEEELTDDFDVPDNDPDCIKTPANRKRAHIMRRQISQSSHRSLSQSDISHSMDEGRQQEQVSINSTNSGTFAATANASSKGKRQRKGCKCRGDCRNQRCGCNSVNQKCTLSCHCTDKCKNRSLSTSPNNDSEDKKEDEMIKREKDLSSSEQSDDETLTNKNNTFLTQQCEDADAAFQQLQI